MSKKATIFLLLLFSLALSGCLIRQPYRKQRRLVHSYRKNKGIELKVPLLTGKSQNCGALAAAMVCSFYGAQCSPQDFYSIVEKKRGGISNRALAAILRRKGFECYNLSGSFDQIRSLLQAGIPPILVLGTKKKELYHYVVVRGISQDSTILRLNNPYCGNELIEKDKLAAQWELTKRSLLVVARKN